MTVVLRRATNYHLADTRMKNRDAGEVRKPLHIGFAGVVKTIVLGQRQTPWQTIRVSLAFRNTAQLQLLQFRRCMMW